MKRYLVLNRDFRLGWQPEDETDDVLAYARSRPNAYTLVYLDRQTGKFMRPGKRRPVDARLKPYDEPVPSKMADPHYYQKTVAQMLEDWKRSDDLWTAHDAATHRRHVRAALLLGLDVPAAVKAEYEGA